MREQKRLIHCLEQGRVILTAEGGIEFFILDYLLNHHLLIFNREDLLNDEIQRERSSKKLEQKLSVFSYPDEKFTIIRVLDSRH